MSKSDGFIARQHGPVDRAPSSLQCGKCGASTGPVSWDVYEGEDGDFGMMALVLCPKCHSPVFGVLANTEAAQQAMCDIARQAIVEFAPKVLRD